MGGFLYKKAQRWVGSGVRRHYSREGFSMTILRLAHNGLVAFFTKPNREFISPYSLQSLQKELAGLPSPCQMSP